MVDKTSYEGRPKKSKNQYEEYLDTDRDIDFRISDKGIKLEPIDTDVNKDESDNRSLEYLSLAGGAGLGAGFAAGRGSGLMSAKEADRLKIKKMRGERDLERFKDLTRKLSEKDLKTAKEIKENRAAIIEFKKMVNSKKDLFGKLDAGIEDPSSPEFKNRIMRGNVLELSPEIQNEVIKYNKGKKDK